MHIKFPTYHEIQMSRYEYKIHMQKKPVILEKYSEILILNDLVAVLYLSLYK